METPEKNQKQPSKDTQTAKQNQDYRDLPAASEKINNTSDLDKEDIDKASEINGTGKTDNIEPGDHLNGR